MKKMFVPPMEVESAGDSGEWVKIKRDHNSPWIDKKYVIYADEMETSDTVGSTGIRNRHFLLRNVSTSELNDEWEEWVNNCPIKIRDASVIDWLRKMPRKEKP